MQVREVMTSPVVTARPDTGFKELVETMLLHDVSGLPVVDADGRLVGMVTEGDLVSKAAYTGTRRPLALVAAYLRGRDPAWVRKAAGVQAAQLMTSPAVSVGAHASLESAARLLLEHRVNRLPVVDGGVVVGIVARHDILSFFAPDDDAIRAAVQSVLDDPLNGPGRYDVSFTVSGGVVRLKGTALFEGDVQALVSMTRHVPGVLAVESEVAYRKRDEHVGPFV